MYQFFNPRNKTYPANIVDEAKKFEEQVNALLLEHDMKYLLEGSSSFTPENTIAQLGLLYKRERASLVIPVSKRWHIFANQNEALNALKEIITKIEYTRNEILCSQYFEHKVSILPAAEQNHVRLLCSVLSYGTVVKEKEAYSLTKDEYAPQIARLVLSGAKLEDILIALRYHIPESEEDYLHFLEDVKTLPSKWLKEIYEETEVFLDTGKNF